MVARVILQVWTLLALRVHSFELVDFAGDLARASFATTSIGSWAGWEANLNSRGQYDDPVDPGRRTLTLEGRRGPKDGWMRTRSREGDVPIGRVVNLGECIVRAFSCGAMDIVTCDVVTTNGAMDPFTYMEMKARPPFVETRTCFSVASCETAVAGEEYELPFEECTGCIPALRRRISVDVKFDTVACDAVAFTVGFDRKLNNDFDMDMEEALFGPQALWRSAPDLIKAVAVENVFKQALAFGYGESADDAVPSSGDTSVSLEPSIMDGRGGFTDGITHIALPCGITVSFGPMRLPDGSVTAPSRREAGVFLEVGMLDESSNGAKVRREFDVTGEIISVAAEVPGVS